MLVMCDHASTPTTCGQRSAIDELAGTGPVMGAQSLFKVVCMAEMPHSDGSRSLQYQTCRTDGRVSFYDS